MSKHPSVLDKFPNYQIDIGIEVHVQLTTKTKLFCSCANEVTKTPNTNICQVCTAQPGALPVLNEQVVDYALMAGLATNCVITPISKFDRKHYFYPDLPKNYQITQNDLPICTNGFVIIRLEDNSTKTVRLARIHIEEDAGKNIHGTEGEGESFVDLNRAGTPLLEIVSYPDIHSSEEARNYLQTLHRLVQYLNICTGNMEEGAFRADTNISVRKKGAEKLGTRIELKNINSFKFVYDAIEYEIERQITCLEVGEPLRQETRLWDTKERKTIVMRSKEELADYRYCQDPDLPFLKIEQKDIENAQRTLPELPETIFERLSTSKGLSPYEACVLIADKHLVDYFDNASKHTASKLLINWILRDVMGHLKENKITILDCKVTPEKLATLINLIDEGKINARSAQKVFQIIAQTGQSPLEIVKQEGLEQMESTQDLEMIVKNVIEKHPQQTAQYKAGQEKLFGFFVGQIMQQTQGKANPKSIQDLLKKYLS